MCRLLGVVSRSGRGVEGELGARRCASFLALSTLHADGWGSAWANAPGSRLARHRQVGPPVNDRARCTLARRTAASIVHLRMATPGLPRCLRNTHPFLVDGVAFAHNGAIAPRDRLRRLLSAGAIADLTGTTDSELYFALVRQYAGITGNLHEGTCAAVGVLRREFPAASLNALLISPWQLTAVHASECAPNPLTGRADDYFQMFWTRRADGSTAFVSSGSDTTGWHPMPLATVVTVELGTAAMNWQSVAEADQPEPSLG